VNQTGQIDEIRYNKKYDVLSSGKKLGNGEQRIEHSERIAKPRTAYKASNINLMGPTES
jgi:hypothetical protein